MTETLDPPVVEDEGFVLRINGKGYDAADLTLNEVEMIEDMCGDVSLDQLNLGRAKTLKAIVYVLLRRDDPDITLEQAGNVKLREVLGAETSDFNAWAAGLRETHPEMFHDGHDAHKRKTARGKWDPVFLRVYGIKPWEMGQYTISEYAAIVGDLERHGLGGL